MNASAVNAAAPDEHIVFAPRLLFLCDDAEKITRQLSGLASGQASGRVGGDASGQACAESLTESEARPLRDDISTDEISPLPAMVNFDRTLGRYPYTGFATQGQRPIGVDAVRNAGITVVVGGQRYGKGSSREHSVVAEMSAGVRLVIAESFERIYRQNADNAGLFTSTDFGLIARIQRGEAIALDELLAGRDGLAAAILRAGGLLRFGRSHAQAFASVAIPESSGPQTLFDKNIARHALAAPGLPAPREVGQGGFVRADLRFIHEYYTAMAGHLLDAEFGDALVLQDKSSIVCFEDHLSYVHRSPVHVKQGLVGGVRGLSQGHRAFVARHGLKDHGYLQALEAGDTGNTGSQGISHAMVAEQYALPGQLIVGTDSHTPHSGALGCVAFGVGTTDMAFAFVNGAVRFTMPPQLKVEFEGQLPAGLTAKDLVLHLLAQPDIRAGAGVGRVFEFAGSVVRGLSVDERATLTNMVAELGGFTGLVAPDDETVRFLRQRRGLDFNIEPWMHSDGGATYERVIRIDCSDLAPMVARPGDPGNGVALSSLANKVRVDIAYGGSCTAGKREDFDHYHAVLAWAAQHGLRVADGVKLYLQFGTAAVRDYCVAQGYLPVFEAVGAELLEPACGACANCGPGASEQAEQVTISAINRNFPGRSGPGQVWLASPPTVAASAIAGEIASFEDLRARHVAAA